MANPWSDDMVAMQDVPVKIRYGAMHQHFDVYHNVYEPAELYHGKRNFSALPDEHKWSITGSNSVSQYDDIHVKAHATAHAAEVHEGDAKPFMKLTDRDAFIIPRPGERQAQLELRWQMTKIRVAEKKKGSAGVMMFDVEQPHPAKNEWHLVITGTVKPGYNVRDIAIAATLRAFFHVRGLTYINTNAPNSSGGADGKQSWESDDGRHLLPSGLLD